MEDIIRKIPGVIEVEAVYTGGHTPNPTYEDLHDGTSGHAESVRVVFDPKKLSYADLLEKWFLSRSSRAANIWSATSRAGTHAG
jgi:peptide methionine sulfoxide reductase msrA/msrB